MAFMIPALWCLYLVCFGLTQVVHSETFHSLPFPKVHSLSSDTLFTGTDILEFTISGDLNDLWNDRGEDPSWHNIVLTREEGKFRHEILNLRAKARGNFRRKKENCSYPPIMLDFSNNPAPEQSIFYGQNELKLVTPCKGEKYVMWEYLTYKIYNLITDRSFRVRPIRINYRRDEKNEETDYLFGFLIEDQDKMARRIGGEILKRDQIRPENTDDSTFLMMALFEYFIGNTDWSVQYRHNVKLVYSDSLKILMTIPYDFDHAGLVYAPYAKPAEALKLRSIRDRRYRGYCLKDLNQLKPMVGLFNQKKNDIISLFSSYRHVDSKYVDRTLDFIEQFYDTLNKNEKLEREISYPCDRNGTGNVVIKGLKI